MGSGVNVAARLESQCKPGEILVSKIVNDQCNKRVDIKIIADGTRELKNISDSFEVFKFEGLLIHEDEFLTDCWKNILPPQYLYHKEFPAQIVFRCNLHHRS